MKELLKGNYKVSQSEEQRLGKKADKQERSTQEKFEASAFERLGGSIAYVKKSSSFVWKGKP